MRARAFFACVFTCLSCVSGDVARRSLFACVFTCLSLVLGGPPAGLYAYLHAIRPVLEMFVFTCFFAIPVFSGSLLGPFWGPSWVVCMHFHGQGVLFHKVVFFRIYTFPVCICVPSAIYMLICRAWVSESMRFLRLFFVFFFMLCAGKASFDENPRFSGSPKNARKRFFDGRIRRICSCLRS